MTSQAIIKVAKKLSLSRQQYRAAELWIRGKSLSEISTELNVSTVTVAVWLREYRRDLAEKMGDKLAALSAERQASIRNLIKEGWRLYHEDPSVKHVKLLLDLELALSKLQGVLVDKSLALTIRAKEEPEKKYLGFEDRLPNENSGDSENNENNEGQSQIIDATVKEVTQ